MKETYQKTIEELYQELDTSKNGLTTKKIKALQRTIGKNELIEKNKKTKVQIFFDQFLNNRTAKIRIIWIK